MQILGLLGMHFDAVVVEVEKNLLFFILALATLCKVKIKVMLYLEGTACFVSRPKSKLKMGMGSERALKWPFLASI